MPRRIPVSDLTVGMTVLREATNGNLVPDCHLAKKFTNGAPASKTQLAFVTSTHQTVVWVNCGHVWVQ